MTPAPVLSAAPTHLLSLPDGTLAYDDAGAGPLVVCLPGLGDVRGQYRFTAPALVQAGFRVVTADLRGHGESSTGWPDYRPESVGRDLIALLEHLAAGPAVLVGNSFAAASAVFAAAERPDLVARLVLVGPFVRDVPMSAMQRAMLGALLTRPWGPAAWSWYYRSLYPAQAPADLDAYRARLKANLREPGRFEALQAMMNSPRAACEQRLSEVRAPVLVVMGERDPDFKDPAAEARLVAERLRGEVAMVPQAGHYPHAEMPDAFLQAFRAFAIGGRS